MTSWISGSWISWILEKLVEKIFVDTGLEYLKDQFKFKLLTDMEEEELQRLKKIYPEVKRVLNASNQSEIRDQNPDLDRWLWQVRDAVEDADDLLDELEYLKHKEQARITEETKGKKRSIPSSSTESIRSKIRKLDGNCLKKDRLKEVVQNLVNVSADVAKYSHLFESTKQKMLHELKDIRETGALPTNNFIGRCEEMESIMQWLSNSSSNEDQSHITSSNRYKNISLLSIVGHGGMGKTTLSQHAYDNVMENEFHVKMWVCVSPNFDVKRVMAGMLESQIESGCNLGSLEGLQKRLKAQLMGKTFLLVLDDIWEDKEEDKIKWENIFAPLAFGSLGSKILVTTRTDSVALMIANVLRSKDHTILKLEGMKEDECLQLLNNYAFAAVENPDAHKKSILEQIVKKVFGSPLAAKVIGGVLSGNMDESYWTTILNSDFGSIEPNQNILFPILKLSYMVLPKPLQSCFSFCSIFPQDHEFHKNDLIRMWIALNFIQPSSEALEDIGERYFDILIKKCFFEKFQHPNGISYYKMHDLLHELAQFVSARECCRVMVDEELPNYETIRHLSVTTDDLAVLEKIKIFPRLRSLFLFFGMDNDKNFADVLSGIFKASSSIRLLFIDARCQMPEAIGDLIHLRYWKYISHTATKLPRSICTLYHMNFIIYWLWATSAQCDFLPRGMNNLFNLRYAELPWDKLRKMHWIGEVRPLQRLNNFFVKNEAGHRINELEHMNELRQLRIYGLEYVTDADEARSAKLRDKGSLTELSLQWGHRNNVDSNLDEEVFDKLQPHNNLKQLAINAYMGTRSAIWMNEVNFLVISNLEYIKLEGCLEWVTLPPFGQLRLLKSLYLHDMPKARSIDYIPSLVVLHIEGADELVDWFDPAAANDSLYPCLTELCLERCPNLRVLPSLPPRLQSLKMVNIRWKLLISENDNLVSFPIETEWFLQVSSSLRKLKFKNLESLQSLPSFLKKLSSLEYLNLSNIPLLKSLPDLPSSLEELKLSELKSLQRLPTLWNISSLKRLSLDEIPLLKSLLGLPTSIENLYIKNLESLEWLPSSLLTFSSLKNLKLSSIPLLTSLPDLPPSLEELSIKNLESLECLPSSLSTFSSLKNLKLSSIPLFKSLPVLPPSIEELSIENLESLECLPLSLSTFSSLKILELSSIPLLNSLPVLPPSLDELYIKNLESLECLPSFLSTSSLLHLRILNVPLLHQLPDLPSSLVSLEIRHCHEELKRRYDKTSGLDQNKVAHIRRVDIE